MSKLYTATVAKVCGCDGFDAIVDLGFGVSVKKHVRIRRREENYRYDGKGSECNHCLVVLIGGKEVLIHDVRDEARWVVADVFITCPTSTLPQVQVAGMGGQFVDVHAAMCWAEGQGWEARRVREALKP